MSRVKKIRILSLSAAALFLLIVQMTVVFAEIEMKPFASIEKPVGLVWTGTDFIVSSGKEEVKLFRISADGKTVEPFAPSFTGQGEVYLALSLGYRDFPIRYIYANSGDAIYEIDASGKDVRAFSTPSKGVDITHLTFDLKGDWGLKLLATTYDGMVWSIDSAGTATPIINLGSDFLPEDIVVAPTDFGELSGYLIISPKKGDSLVAVSNKDLNVKILAEFPGESPERVLRINLESNLYIAKYDEDVIMEISKDQLSDYIGGLIVITEAEEDNIGSILVIENPDYGMNVVKQASLPAKTDFEEAVFVLEDELIKAPQRKASEPINKRDLMMMNFAILAIVVVASLLGFWRLRQR